MRLMYISSYKVQGGKEAVLHRQVTVNGRRSAWHSTDCVICKQGGKACDRSRESLPGLQLLLYCSACPTAAFEKVSFQEV